MLARPAEYANLQSGGLRPAIRRGAGRYHHDPDDDGRRCSRLQGRYTLTILVAERSRPCNVGVYPWPPSLAAIFISVAAIALNQDASHQRIKHHRHLRSKALAPPFSGRHPPFNMSARADSQRWRPHCAPSQSPPPRNDSARPLPNLRRHKYGIIPAKCEPLHICSPDRMPSSVAGVRSNHALAARNGGKHEETYSRRCWVH